MVPSGMAPQLMAMNWLCLRALSEWMIFAGAIETINSIGVWGLVLSIIILGNALLSTLYYLPIIRRIYLEPKENIKNKKK
jgi:NADH:ubiquinone oxidoreductase subunit 2 (subunit N)